jgi:hypothetical protein
MLARPHSACGCRGARIQQAPRKPNITLMTPRSSRKGKTAVTLSESPGAVLIPAGIRRQSPPQRQLAAANGWSAADLKLAIQAGPPSGQISGTGLGLPVRLAGQARTRPARPAHSPVCRPLISYRRLASTALSCLRVRLVTRRANAVTSSPGWRTPDSKVCRIASRRVTRRRRLRRCRGGFQFNERRGLSCRASASKACPPRDAPRRRRPAPESAQGPGARYLNEALEGEQARRRSCMPISRQQNPCCPGTFAAPPRGRERHLGPGTIRISWGDSGSPRSKAATGKLASVPACAHPCLTRGLGGAPRRTSTRHERKLSYGSG